MSAAFTKTCTQYKCSIVSIQLAQYPIRSSPAGTISKDMCEDVAIAKLHDVNCSGQEKKNHEDMERATYHPNKARLCTRLTLLSGLLWKALRVMLTTLLARSLGASCWSSPCFTAALRIQRCSCSRCFGYWRWLLRRRCRTTTSFLSSRTSEGRWPWYRVCLATHVWLSSGIVNINLDTGIVGFVGTRERYEV